MKNVVLILIVLFAAGCSNSDPVRGDAAGNFTGTYKYAIASPLGFVSKYTWVVTQRSVNVLDFDMTKEVVQGNGARTVTRENAAEVEVIDEKRLRFSYTTTSGHVIGVSMLAGSRKLSVNSYALQGEDATNVPWYVFEKQ